ncbi:MAG: TonB-dependent receptor [bacterium]
MREHAFESPARFTIGALGALALMAGPLAAQVRTGSIMGIVRDDAGTPLASVEVTATKQSLTVRTDSAGKFLLAALPAGPVDLSFRRLAFEPVAITMMLPANDTTEVEVKLTVVAQRLSAVMVQGHPGKVRVLTEFEARRKAGIGHFITRAQIEQRHPVLLSDMLRMIPGAILAQGETGKTNLRFSRVARNNCPPMFYVDGIQVTGFTIDDMPPGDVEGVELYAGTAGLPPEFNRMRSTSNCGSVLIWTRVPGN